MLKDSTERYGSLTRCLHWVMAICLAFMLVSAASRFFNKDAEFTKALFKYHGQVGFTVLILGVIRVLWAISQRPHRPVNSPMAKLGHIALYTLMIAVPVIAFLRVVGSGRPFVYWNVLPLVSPSENEIDWMVALGNTLHGNLGWILFLFIVGHIVMAVKHRLAGGAEDVFPRMIGK